MPTSTATGPTLANGDYDPSQPLDEEDVEMDEQEQQQRKTELSAVEINILIHLYLRESGFSHSAFTLFHESRLQETELFRHFNPSYRTAGLSKPNSNGTESKSQANGGSSSKHGQQQPPAQAFGELGPRIPRGELVRKLWKALKFEEIERHVGNQGKTCGNQFRLLTPHTCPDDLRSSRKNPPKPFPKMSASPPPRLPPVIPQDAEEDSDAGAGPSRRAPSNGPAKQQRQRQQQQTSRRTSEASSSRAAVDADEDEEMDGDEDNNSTTTSGKQRKDKAKAKDKAGKNKADAEEDEQMDGDEDYNSTATSGKKRKDKSKGKDKDKENNNNNNNNLAVPSSTRPSSSRSKSPASKKDKDRVKEPTPTPTPAITPAPTSGKGKDNPLWFAEGDIGVFAEHRDIVYCVGWNSANLDLLASVSRDSTAKLWNLGPSRTPGHRALELTADGTTTMKHGSVFAKGLESLSWHPEGTILATGAKDGQVRLYTPNGTDMETITKSSGMVNAIKFSPSGSKLLTATSQHEVILMEVTPPKSRMTVHSAHANVVNDVDWHDDTVFASAGNDYKIFIFRTGDKRPRYTFSGHNEDVNRIKWSPDHSSLSDLFAPSASEAPIPSSKRYLASVADDGKLMVWQMDRYPETRASTAPTTKSSGSVSPTKRGAGAPSASAAADDAGDNDHEDDYFAASAAREQNLVVSWQVVDEETANKRMNSLDWSPERSNGRMLLAAGGQDSPIKIYDVISKSLVHTLPGFEAGTGSLAFSPAGFRGTWGAIAGGSWNAIFKIWDVETGEILRAYELEEDESKQRSRATPFITCTSWRPDGEHVAVSLHNRTVMTFYVGDLRRPPTTGTKGGESGGAGGEAMEVDSEARG